MIKSFTPHDPPHVQLVRERLESVNNAVLAEDLSALKKILQDDVDNTLAGVALRVATVENVLSVVQLTAPKLNTNVVSDNLIQAAGRGLVDVVLLLLPYADVTYKQCSALASAAANGHQQIFELLCTKWSAPYQFIAHVATNAASQGHLDILKQCMALTSFDLTHPLIAASQHGHIHCVQHLRHLCDPEARIRAIVGADQHKENDVVDLLWPDVRACPNWTDLAPSDYKFNVRRSHLSRLKKADDDNQMLHQSVASLSKPKSSNRKL